MEKVVPFLRIATGQTPRAVIFLSGSGSNADKILAACAAAGVESPLTVAALVTDAPETSRARELAQQYKLPLVESDIRLFYRDRGEGRVSIATPRGQEIREEWTDCLRKQLAAVAPDFGILAGFVPLTNITGDFPCLNVHPGDLTYLKDGQRYLVGLHTMPIERAILEGLDCLRSSVIIAQPYSGSGGEMDSGPILGVSAPVEIDLQGHSLADLAAAGAARAAKRPPGGYRDILASVAAHNQERLKEKGDWTVFPPVVMDFARGHFAGDANGRLLYRVGRGWHPVETVVYGENRREIVFREPLG